MDVFGDVVLIDDWMVVIDGGVMYMIIMGDGYLDLGVDMLGMIILFDGSIVDFDGIECIEW